MTLLLVAMLAAQVTYSCGDRGCEVTDWSKAPRVFTATPDVPVREKPDAAAPVNARLRFGVPVKILEVSSDLVAVDGRTDRWYRVAAEGKAGYVFGDGLTSARFEDDFDGDGQSELATVAFTADHKIRVRIADTFVDLQPAGQAYVQRKGGHAYPDVVKKSAAGVPLVHVDSHVEACADVADIWVSWVDRKPRIALELWGLIDPPTMSTYKVQFTKKGALVTHSHVEQENAPPVKSTQTWPLDGGVFTRPSRAE